MKIITLILPECCLCIAMIVWGSSLITLKIALVHFTPFEVMAGRMFVASFIGIPFLFQIMTSIKDKEINKILIFTVICQPCLFFIFESCALLYTSASQAGMITSLSPLLAVCAATIFLKEKNSLSLWIGSIIAFIGVGILSFFAKSTEIAPDPLLGNFLESCAVLCGMTFAVCVRFLTKKMSAFVLTATMSYGGFLFFVPLAFCPIMEQYATVNFVVYKWQSIFCIIYLGSFVTFLGYGFYNYGISKLGVGKAVIYNNSIPVITLILSFFILDEKLSSWQILAVLLVLLGIWFTYLVNVFKKILFKPD